MTISSDTSQISDDRLRRETERRLRGARLEIERRAYEASFLTFAKDAWKIVEPQRPLSISWHHELVAEYLTLAFRHELRRLIVNMPPQHTKSRLVTVLWPCWCWAQEPSAAWMFSSYSNLLSVGRHSEERRTIIRSDWFQSHWAIELDDALNTKAEFLNTERGVMIATSTGGTAIGKSADFVVVDDPTDPAQALSDAERLKANTHFDQALYTRRRDVQKSVVVIVMQRLHDGDLTGHVLEAQAHSDEKWTQVELKAEEEQPKAVYKFPISKRTKTRKEGELLWPERFPKRQLNDIKRVLGSWAYAAQYQQSPTPRGGGIFKRDWWNFYKADPRQVAASADLVFQSWDMTFKEADDSDFVAGHVYASKGADLYLIDRICDRMSFIAAINAVQTMAGKWPISGAKLVEDKANGPAVISTLQHKIPGLIPVEPQGGKIVRAQASSPTVEAGNVYLPHPSVCPWVHDFIEALARFPMAVHDDDVDAFSQGENWWRLNSAAGWMEFMRTHDPHGHERGKRGPKGKREPPPPTPIENALKTHCEKCGTMYVQGYGRPCPGCGYEP